MKIDPTRVKMNVKATGPLLGTSNELCDRVSEESLDSVLTQFSKLFTRTSKPFYVFFACSDKPQSEIIVSKIEDKIDPKNAGNIITFDLQEQFGYNPFLQLGQIEEQIAKSTRDPVFILANGFENVMKAYVGRSGLGAHDFCQTLKESDSNKELIKKLNGRKCIIIVHLGESQGDEVLNAGRNSVFGCDFKDGHFDVLQKN